MSFFNSKEQVLDVKITGRGKYLLSKGKFFPKYYGFFDDEIIYDINYGGVEEKQNEIQERILNGSCYTHPQVNFSNIVDKLNEEIEKVDNNNNKIYNNSHIDKNGLNNLIGTCDFKSSYAPAWEISMLSGEISDYKDSQITQINLSDAKLRIYSKNKQEVNLESITDTVIIEDEKQYILRNETNLHSIVDVYENNSSDKIKNFTIEVFVEEDGTWKQLNFSKNLTNIENNILLDDEMLIDPEEELNENNVEYYFDLMLDGDVQISENLRKQIENIYGTDSMPPYGGCK